MVTTGPPVPGERGRSGARRILATGGMRSTTGFSRCCFPAITSRFCPTTAWCETWEGSRPPTSSRLLEQVGRVSPTEVAEPSGPGTFGVYLSGSWHRVQLHPESIPADDPIGSLDVSLLQELVLAPILGVGDPRTDKRIDFVGGIRGTAELERRVDSGEMAIAFSLFPTTVDQLMAVSDAGAIMPPKSTWFEPKLRSGLFVHTF